MSRTVSTLAAVALGALYGGAAVVALKLSEAVSPIDGCGLSAAAAVYAVLGGGWLMVAFLKPTQTTSWLAFGSAVMTTAEIIWGWAKDGGSPIQVVETLVVLTLVSIVVASHVVRSDGPTKPVQPTRAAGPHG